MESQYLVFSSNKFTGNDWVCVVYKVNQPPDTASVFSVLTLKCRQLLFEFAGQVAACPRIDYSSISVICQPQLLASEKFQTVIKKLQLCLSFQPEVTPSILEECVAYTVSARLAPIWNKVGDWFLSGRQFLHAANPIPAVKMKFHVADDRFEISLKACYVSFPLLKPEDLGVSNETVESFIGSPDPDLILTTEQFNSPDVLVLPRLTKAKLVSVTKQLPKDSKFTEWAAMKRYWKNMYGYRLECEDGVEPVVYYNVSFFGNPPLTYPEWTVRKFDPRPLPRTDPRPIMEQFIKEVVQCNRTICGLNFSLQRKPINPSYVDFKPCSAEKSNLIGWPRNQIPYRDIDKSQSIHCPSWTFLDTLSSQSVSSLSQTSCTNGDNVNNKTSENKYDDSGYATEDVSFNGSGSRLNQTFLSKVLSNTSTRRTDTSMSSMMSAGSSSKTLGFMSRLFKPMSNSNTEELNRNIPKASAGMCKVGPQKREPPVRDSEDPNPRKKTISNVDIGSLVAANRTQEISKLNVATLLDYCRKANIKEAKSKSKKEELLKLILSKNILLNNEQ